MIRPAPDLRIVGAELQAHPAAEIFPMMTGADFDALKEDIRLNGQREPIIVHGGRILDGRNRYRACRQLGLEAETLDWNGRGAPEAFVVSMNLHRRHLSESQRAMIAAKLATARQGERTDIEPRSNLNKVSKTEAAELLNVSLSSVSNARKVLAEGTPEEIAGVIEGTVAVGQVAKLIRAGQPGDKRKNKREAPLSQNGKNPERIQRMQMQANIWALLSGALEALTALPLPADVVEIINANTARRRIVDEKLARSLQWLKDFDDARNRG